MSPVYSVGTYECPVCGECGCESAFVCLDDDEADALGVLGGDVVCRECAGGES